MGGSCSSEGHTSKSIWAKQVMLDSSFSLDIKLSEWGKGNGSGKVVVEYNQNMLYSVLKKTTLVKMKKNIS